MTENIEQKEMNIDSDEYLLLISQIYTAFENLRKKLDCYHSDNCSYFLDMAYQTFINNVKEDIQH